jgi:hypothetical protein
VGCRTRLHHMTVNTLAPRYRQLCTALTLPSALQFNQNPQLSSGVKVCYRGELNTRGGVYLRGLTSGVHWYPRGVF